MSSDGGNLSLGSLVAKTASKTAKSIGSRSSSSGRSSSSSRSRSYSSPSRSSSSSRSSGGSSAGRSLGSSISSVAKKTVAPNLNSYLGGDSVYQQALSGGKRSLADFLSELNRRRGEATTQYNTTLGSMERDRTKQLEDIRNEYASRGLIQSGVYADQVGNFESQFGDQMNALKQQQAALMADLLSQQTNYQRENDLAMQAAKQEALARRAAKYGA